MTEAKHLTMAELEAGLDTIRQSPKDEGVVTLIVRRPQVDAREVLEEGELDLVEGLVGDLIQDVRNSRRGLVWTRLSWSTLLSEDGFSCAASTPGLRNQA